MRAKPNTTRSQPSAAAGVDPAGDELRAPTRGEQRTARIMGAWFLATFVAIPAFFFYEPVLDNPEYVLGADHDTAVGIGALLEVLLAVAGIATAVVIFPIVKRVNESVALGYIATRTVESILILVGVVSVMSVVALRQDLVGTDEGAAITDTARALLAVHDQTSLLGPQFCAPGSGTGSCSAT
jgi:hypothetical protein